MVTDRDSTGDTGFEKGTSTVMWSPSVFTSGFAANPLLDKICTLASHTPLLVGTPDLQQYGTISISAVDSSTVVGLIQFEPVVVSALIVTRNAPSPWMLASRPMTTATAFDAPFDKTGFF
jgi:hypothetical protein